MPTTQVPKGAQQFSEHEGDILEAQSLGTGIALIIKCQKYGTAKDLGQNLNRTVTVDPGVEAIKITAPGQKAWYL